MRADGNKVHKTGYQFLGNLVEGLTLPVFQAGLKWRGGDLQTMRNTIMGPGVHLGDDFERVSFDIGEKGQLQGALHRTEDAAHRPLVVILHGLTGDENSPNVISSAHHFIDQGYGVLRLNLRGAGPSANSSHGTYHGGLTEDLVQVVAQLGERGYGTDIILYGISLGGNMMLKYLGELGARAGIRAAIGVSVPLSLKAVQVRLMETRNRMYHNYLLLGMKNYVKRLGREIDPDLLEKAQSAGSILEYDDQFVAPSHEMADAETYYQQHSSEAFLDDIRVPTLLIHAENDPWVPVESYQARPWDRSGWLSLVLTEDGGHVGFHDKHSKVPWHERVAVQFLKNILGEAG